nr:ribosomal protein S4 [Ipomoea batatas]GMC90891.1 ribosomal protein S4 [Ipomoea batatas]
MGARLAQGLEHRICNAMVIGLTNKRPRAESDLRNQSRSGKKSQYCIRLEEKQKLRFHYGLTERQFQVVRYGVEGYSTT